MNDELKIGGGCMCGAVRYEAMGEPMTVAYCHCTSCRRHTGAPVVAFVAYEAQRVQFTKGKRKFYNSSPGVSRAFCGDCGTPLTWEGASRRAADISLIEFHISTLDDPLACAPNLHWFESERLAWFDTTDQLPRYHGLDGQGIEPDHYGPQIT